VANVEVLSKPVEAGFPDEWYDLGLESHFWFLWRLQALHGLLAAHTIPLTVPLRVLEVGCGTGSFRKQMESSTAWVIDGADLNEPAVRSCSAGRGRTLLYNVEDEHAAMVGTYDGVLLFDVLEHVGDPQRFLKASLRHLKPGGWAIVNVPASMTLHSRYDEVVGHFRRYSKENLAAALRGAGDHVECIDLRYWGLSLFPLALARKLLLRWVKDDAEVVRIGFRPPGQWINRALTALMRLETAMLKKPPIGTSVLALARVNT